MKGALRDIFVPTELHGLMGRVLGGLSILALVSHAYRFGLSDTFHAIVRYYDRAVDVFVGWAAPYIAHAFDTLSRITGIRMTVEPNWRHVFVILLILFVRDASVAFSDHRHGVAFTRLTVGFVIAFLASVLATAQLVAPSSLLRNLQMATVPYIGIYLYDLAMYVNAAAGVSRASRHTPTPSLTVVWRRHIFRDGFLRASARFGLVLLVIAASCITPPIAKLPYPGGGLLVLALATVANIGYWVHRGVRHARVTREVEESLRTAPAMALFKSSEAGRFALAVTSVLVWATMFILINAGFGLLGL